MFDNGSKPPGGTPVQGSTLPRNFYAYSPSLLHQPADLDESHDSSFNSLNFSSTSYDRRTRQRPGIRHHSLVKRHAELAMAAETSLNPRTPGCSPASLTSLNTSSYSIGHHKTRKVTFRPNTFLEALKKQGQAWRAWQEKVKTERKTERKLFFEEAELLSIKKRLEEHLERVKNREVVDKYIECNKVTSL